MFAGFPRHADQEETEGEQTGLFSPFGGLDVLLKGGAFLGTGQSLGMAGLVAEGHQPASRLFHGLKRLQGQRLHLGVGYPVNLARQIRIQDGLANFPGPFLVDGERVGLEEKVTDAVLVVAFAHLRQNVLGRTQAKLRTRDGGSHAENATRRTASRGGDGGLGLTGVRAYVEGVLHKRSVREGERVKICFPGIEEGAGPGTVFLVQDPTYCGDCLRFLEMGPGQFAHDEIAFQPYQIVRVGEVQLVQQGLFRIKKDSPFEHDHKSRPALLEGGNKLQVAKDGRVGDGNEDRVRCESVEVDQELLQGAQTGLVVAQENLEALGLEGRGSVAQVVGSAHGGGRGIFHVALGTIFAALVESAGRIEEHYPLRVYHGVHARAKLAGLGRSVKGFVHKIDRSRHLLEYVEDQIAGDHP